MSFESLTEFQVTFNRFACKQFLQAISVTLQEAIKVRVYIVDNSLALVSFQQLTCQRHEKVQEG